MRWRPCSRNWRRSSGDGLRDGDDVPAHGAGRVGTRPRGRLPALAKDLQGLQPKLEKVSANCLVRRV
jgi:hypothetical protein